MNPHAAPYCDIINASIDGGGSERISELEVKSRGARTSASLVVTPAKRTKSAKGPVARSFGGAAPLPKAD